MDVELPVVSHSTEVCMFIYSIDCPAQLHAVDSHGNERSMGGEEPDVVSHQREKGRVIGGLALAGEERGRWGGATASGRWGKSRVGVEALWWGRPG
jgi:hypothetical protein